MCMCGSGCVCVHEFVSVFVGVCVSLHVYVLMCVCVCVCLCVCEHQNENLKIPCGEFNIGYCPIKHKVMACNFNPFTTILTVKSYISAFPKGLKV